MLSAATTLALAVFISPAARADVASSLDAANMRCTEFLAGAAGNVTVANSLTLSGSYQNAAYTDMSTAMGLQNYNVSQSGQAPRCSLPPAQQDIAAISARAKSDLDFDGGGGFGIAGNASYYNQQLAQGRTQTNGQSNVTLALNRQNTAIEKLNPFTGRPVTVSASSSIETSNYGVSKLHDLFTSSISGSTGWIAAGGSTNHTESLTMTFTGFTRTRLELWPRTDFTGGFPKAMTVSVQNGSTWQTLASATNMTRPSSGPYTLALPATSGTTFKVDFTSLEDLGGWYSVHLAELRIY
ncbi:hypothetical protein UK23_31095 [Lentzea aerocolonigenes]|uniref:F5/8 type C domain-containing protein n=1 Tax=Lentzea aerocolonigenes TaxID=68170 RepID=A0A0F0GN49_LENAE|nr:hypothetical protein [Lentzea aerocolonigenes]KJK43996.1 hypothetical protein UK23_31095 [Lentzea aerocolonigenes]